MSRYLIPKSRSRVEIRVSNSRFIATAAPVTSAKEAQRFLRDVRREMPDATHHVYAFKIGYGSSVTEGMSDDGEPSGTAGPPVLAVLRGANIGDVVLVVTRYFGGTKLGTGGLVSAYTKAAQVVLEVLKTEEKVTRVGMELVVDYALLVPVRRLLAQYDGVAEAEEFGAEVRLSFQIPQENVNALTEGIRNLTAGQVSPTVR